MPPYVTSGAVNWVETDAGGMIHNTSAVRWAEAAEHAFYLEVFPALRADRLPRRRTEATFHRPLRFRDRYNVELWVERVGRTSVTYAWSVISDGQTCIEGRHVVIYVDEHGASAPWPDGFAAAVAGFQLPAAEPAPPS